MLTAIPVVVTTVLSSEMTADEAPMKRNPHADVDDALVREVEAPVTVTVRDWVAPVTRTLLHVALSVADPPTHREDGDDPKEPIMKLPATVAARVVLVCDSTVPTPDTTMVAPCAVAPTNSTLDAPMRVEEDTMDTVAVVNEPPTRRTSKPTRDDAELAVNERLVADPLIAMTQVDDDVVGAFHTEPTTLMSVVEVSPRTLKQCAAADVMVELLERIDSAETVPK